MWCFFRIEVADLKQYDRLYEARDDQDCIIDRTVFNVYAVADEHGKLKQDYENEDHRLDFEQEFGAVLTPFVYFNVHNEQ